MALINFAIPTLPPINGNPINPKILVPDIPAIVKFANGDLGIADKIKSGMLFKNISKMNNPQQLKTFLSLTGSTLAKSPESYFNNGKIKISQSDIQMGNSPGDLGGLKALEMALIQSIFETQKPHMEVIKLVVENFVKIEDIIARVLAVGGSSAKPKGNPNALGYGGGSQSSISSAISKLGVLSNLKGPGNQNNSGITGTQSQSPTQSTPLVSTSSPIPGIVGITESVVYSTGIYDPNYEYTYTYIYENSNDKVTEPSDGEGSADVDPILVDDDGMPDVMIMGVYDKNWNLIPCSHTGTYVTNLYNDYEWVLKSNKYFGAAPMLPYWNGTLSDLTNDVNTYTSYFINDATQKLIKKGITGSQQTDCLNQINSTLESTLSNGHTTLQENLINLFSNCFLNLSNNNTDNLPSGLSNISRPYSPFGATISSWESGEQIPGNSVFIDPETLYDMKIIVCNSTQTIQYHNPLGGVSSGNILAFITNEMKITMSTGENFSVDYMINGNLTSYNNIPEFVIDNPNTTNNTYNLTIKYLDIPPDYKQNFEYYPFYDSNGYAYTVTIQNYQGSYYAQASSTQVSSSNVNVNAITLVNGLSFYFDSNNKFQYVTIFDGDPSEFLNFSNLYTRNNVVLNPDDGTNTITSENISNNLLRVTDAYYQTGLLIDSSKITNDQLATNKPYSSNPYGTPFKDDNGNYYRQSVDYITRYQRSATDTDPIYIVEGILSSKDDRSLSDAYAASKNNSGNGNSGGGGGDYHVQDSLKVMNVFINFLIDIFSKTIPSINQLISLIQNPSSFIVEILKAKLGDNNGTESPKFGFFSKHFLDELKQLSNKKDVKDKKDFVKNKSTLKNYVYVDDKGVPNFLLDGTGTVKLFGSAPILSSLPAITFGMKSQLGTLATNSPAIPPITLIFDVNANKVGTDKTTQDLSGMSDNQFNDMLKNSLLGNSNLKNPDYTSSKVKLPDGTYTSVSIEYSTGVYQSNFDYTYIYVTEYIGSLIKEADDLANRGNTEEALQKLAQALQNDPKNQFIKDKLSELEKKNPLGTHGEQPLFSFLLNLVTLPLKVVFGIISYILNLLKSLTNPFELASKIAEFISFKWMVDLFDITNENSMFRMANLQFDIPKFLTKWLPSIKSGSESIFDMSDVMKIPWIPKLPTYSLDQMKSMIYGMKGSGTPNPVVIKFLTGILGLIEGIINGFIDFIWGLFGLNGLLPPPHIRLTKNINEDISPKDIIDLLNGTYFMGATSSVNPTGFFNPNDPNGSGGTTPNYNFVYEVKTSDGRDIRNLDEQALADFMAQNQNLQFFFN
jgi:hypothetical protein